MTARTYNRMVYDALRNQPLRGTRRGGDGTGPHHWRATFRKADAQHWLIFVGAGTVNDHMAGITYRIEDDPRAWKMTQDYPAYAAAQRLYGTGVKLVDRPLTDRVDPPHIVLTSPSADDPRDLGDFVKVVDDRTHTPDFFRSAEQWDLDLYRASVFLTTSPKNFLRVEDFVHFPLPARVVRYRVTAAAQMPPRIYGTQAGGEFELAQVFLTRDPRARNPVNTDKLYIRQRCFWSLCTANNAPNPFGNYLPAGELSLANGLAAGIGDAFAVAASAAAQALQGVILNAIGIDFEKAASVEFWSAA